MGAVFEVLPIASPTEHQDQILSQWRNAQGGRDRGLGGCSADGSVATAVERTVSRRGSGQHR